MTPEYAALLRERFGDPTDLALEYVSRRWARQPLPGGRIEHTQQRRDRLRQAVVDTERQPRYVPTTPTKRPRTS